MISVLTVLPRGEVTAGWWAFATVMAVITIATVIGNLSVVIALCKVKRSPTHFPLTSLVVADLLVGLVVLPIAAARELFVFHLPRIVCAFWSTMDVLCCTASILSLCVLGWERWSGITAPLARARRGERARLLAYTVWPIASAVALPTAFIPSPRHFHPGEMAKACTVNTNIGYVFFSISFSFYLPAGMMIVMYGYILRALAAPPPLRVHRGRSPNTNTNNIQSQTPNKPISNPVPHPESTQDLNSNDLPRYSTPKGRKLNIPGISKSIQIPSPLKSPRAFRGFMSRQRRATRTIIKLMGLFLVCWTPFFVMLPVDSLFDCVRDTTWQWCTWLGYLNSALNPLVYSAASPSVRRAFRASFSSSNDVAMTTREKRSDGIIDISGLK
ncbi:tyramine/octopamine receptor-like [Zerene cesonia]|uniref:tyramine/octopamine receptor-like n=1 Tax=Zerene cesonia TaxID=33412 RepID=UPI0018E4E50E|nr:tyramine/octopamine receptor-like [Zerene cesonia]